MNFDKCYGAIRMPDSWPDWLSRCLSFISEKYSAICPPLLSLKDDLPPGFNPGKSRAKALLLIRHGQANHNARPNPLWMLSHLLEQDTPLTPLGEEQARKCRELLLQRGWLLRVSAFLVSPLSRAVHTARLILDPHRVIHDPPSEKQEESSPALESAEGNAKNVSDLGSGIASIGAWDGVGAHTADALMGASMAEKVSWRVEEASLELEPLLTERHKFRCDGGSHAKDLLYRHPFLAEKPWKGIKRLMGRRWWPDAFEADEVFDTRVEMFKKLLLGRDDAAVLCLVGHGAFFRALLDEHEMLDNATPRWAELTETENGRLSVKLRPDWDDWRPEKAA